MRFKGTPLQTSGLIPRVRQTFLPGAEADDISLMGIRPGEDLLLSVTLVRPILTAGNPNTVTFEIADLTSEFRIMDRDVISNSPGTDSTGGFLVVLWYDSDLGITTRPF